MKLRQVYCHNFNLNFCSQFVQLLEPKSKNKMGKKWLGSLVIGSMVRGALFYSGFSPIFQNRVEISTPLNSWINVQEGLYLMKHKISPYDGDTFHETPLSLLLADHLAQLPQYMIYLIFILMDIVTGIGLSMSVDEAKFFYLQNSQKKSQHVKDSKDLKIDETEKYGENVLMCYMLNPFIILSCVGLTTTVFGNMTTALAILGMLKGWRLLATPALALSVHQSMYPISLLIPLILCVFRKEEKYAAQRKKSPPNLFLSVMFTLVLFGIAFGSLVYYSYIVTHNFEFLDRTYGFILNVRDLKPNIGLFWYFFTEMFEHFYLLFICTFQINAFIYIIPLTLRFYQEPPLLIYAFCAVMSIFKSYPAAGDVGFYLSLVPMWKHLVPYMQQKFIVACFFISTSVLAPVLWYLWIYTGSANANFYFGVTIAFGTAQIFLLTDVILSYLKREYYLKHGLTKDSNGKPVSLMLA